MTEGRRREKRVSRSSLFKFPRVRLSKNLGDQLTQLPNRARFAEFVQHVLEHSPLPGAVLMLDLDHFKQVNDTHGHAVGDEALKAVAEVIGRVMGRPGDQAIRYGGEEFLIILPDASLGVAVSPRMNSPGFRSRSFWITSWYCVEPSSATRWHSSITRREKFSKKSSGARATDCTRSILRTGKRCARSSRVRPRLPCCISRRNRTSIARSMDRPRSCARTSSTASPTPATVARASAP